MSISPKISRPASQRSLAQLAAVAGALACVGLVSACGSKSKTNSTSATTNVNTGQVARSIQALETIKLLLDIGEPLRGRLLAYDALEETFRNYKVRRDPNCPACGEGAQIVLAEYDDLCLPHAVLADGTVTSH